jgi:hypothetical protein
MTLSEHQNHVIGYCRWCEKPVHWNEDDGVTWPEGECLCEMRQENLEPWRSTVKNMNRMHDLGKGK